jgi:hypothetical protein
VKLSEGKNNIEVSVFNEKGVESIIETFSMFINLVRPKRTHSIFWRLVLASTPISQKI